MLAEAAPVTDMLMPVEKRQFQLDEIAFTEDGDTFSVHVTPPQVEDQGVVSRILEDIVNRSQRDVNRHPSSARRRASLGLALLNNARVEDAIAEFEEALRLDPRQYVAAINLAHTKVTQGKLDEALDLYLELSKGFPNLAEPWSGLAQVEMVRGQFDSAIELYRKAADLRPAEARQHYQLGVALLAAGHWDEAVTELEAAAGIDERNAATQHAIGVAYAIKGDFYRAVSAFNAALELAPDMPEALLGLANVCLEHGDIKAAASSLERYLNIDTDNYEVRELLAWIYLQVGQHAAAKSELFRAAHLIQQVGGETEAHQARLINNLGACYFQQQDYEAAVRQFQNAIRLLPGGSPSVYHNLAQSYVQTGNREAAKQVLSQYLEQFPESTATRTLLADYLASEVESRYEEAVNQYSLAIQSGNAAAGAYASLGYLLADYRNDFGAALRVLQDGYERFCDDILIRNNLAYTYLKLGDVERASALLEQLTNEDPNHDQLAVTTATQGLLQILQGDLVGGVQSYMKAEQVARRQGDIDLVETVRQKMYLELAQEYYRQGKYKNARRKLRKGLGLKKVGLYYRDLQALAAKL